MKRVTKMPTSNDSNRAYDWDTLLDGSVWKLSKTEYRNDLKSFRSVANTAGRKRGLRVSVKAFGNYAYLQATPMTEQK